MTRRLIDYSGGRPGGAAIKAAGYDGAIRYLWPFTPKGIDADEIEDLRATGNAIGFVYEWSEDRAVTAGYDGGKDDARYARGRADVLGVPGHVTIYFAVDRDTDESTYPDVARYFEGINSVLPTATVGGYVEKKLGEYLRARKLIARVWQPAAMSWSDYQIDPTANIRQLADGGAVNGVGIDPNLCFEDAGLWEPEEDEMSPEERELLILTATVNFGWSDGTDFKDVPEALARAREMAGGNVLTLVRIDELKDQVNALTAIVGEMTAPANTTATPDPRITVIQEQLAKIGEILAVARTKAGGAP